MLIDTGVLTSEIQCLTDAVFHEARNQSIEGMRLVYHTILNRAADNRWLADTACGVVYQPLQYSFTLLPVTERERRVSADEETYTEIAEQVTIWYKEEYTTPEGYEGVNHYLRCDWRDKVSWDDKMTFLGEVGDHCFYKGR